MMKGYSANNNAHHHHTIDKSLEMHISIAVLKDIGHAVQYADIAAWKYLDNITFSTQSFRISRRTRHNVLWFILSSRIFAIFFRFQDEV